MSGQKLRSRPVAGKHAKLRKPIRFAEMARDLAGGIVAGNFPVGSLLPTEFELCEQYGASRHTVRLAIGELVELGLVSRRRKVGTRVEAATATGRYRQSLASVEDLVQFGATHRREIRGQRMVTADAALARLLGCRTGRKWLRISTLRRDARAGSPPVACTEVYVDPAYAELPDLASAEPDTLMSTLIERRYGRHIAEIRQEVEAILVPPDLAAPLHAREGAAALRVVRRYLDAAAEMFEVTVSIHCTDGFTISTRLQRDRPNNHAVTHPG
jgi:GntR family transcriptional regulator